MCKPRKTSIEKQYISPAPISHIGGHPYGVWPVNPLPPDLTQGCEKKKMTAEPGWKPPLSPPSQLKPALDGVKPKKFPPVPPPQVYSDSDGAKAKQFYQNPSGSDKKQARPDTTTMTSPPPRSYEAEGNTRKKDEYKKPPLPPPSSDKQKMRTAESLVNNNLNETPKGYWTSAPEEQNRNSTGAKWSSQEISSNHAVFPKTRQDY